MFLHPPEQVPEQDLWQESRQLALQPLPQSVQLLLVLPPEHDVQLVEDVLPPEHDVQVVDEVLPPEHDVQLVEEVLPPEHDVQVVEEVLPPEHDVQVADGWQVPVTSALSSAPEPEKSQ